MRQSNQNEENATNTKQMKTEIHNDGHYVAQEDVEEIDSKKKKKVMEIRKRHLELDQSRSLP